ncbi:TetR/AcrR family transcriptional regulator [Sedimentisphaera salicampi]|uniref:Putative DNA-binding transcriptional regulator n=1 Tax=Sedimentisphaera salicampi TaxID=1941349 RepID=A0A1W6LM95_9BACT|nr:TetR/AcrR family transcriptional regulator [Sedimentisphaera salicampi]ARN56881.1 putative DNA-binding transcriptional regulator [Sedimentisphaera salicampi]OXU15050.1 putative DNA-binding transcriptional regulator [Sedimentisphaera salicampi]
MKYSTSEITVQNLINSAGELAARVGFPNVTTRGIARLSGENIGTIHYHFGSKDNLLEAVVYEVIEKKKDLLRNVLKEGGELSSKAEQAKMIRKLVRRNIDNMFRSENPVWHSRAVFQVLQTEWRLKDIVQKEMIDPEINALKAFFKKVKPSLTDEQAFQHALLMGIPVYFHADYSRSIKDKLETEEYSEEYLNYLEDVITCQTQCAVGLASDK